MVGLAEAIGRDVGVDLRRRDVSVAEHFLDRTQVGPVIEQMRREGMTQHVGRNRLADIGGAGGVFHDLPDARAVHGIAARRQK